MPANTPMYEGCDRCTCYCSKCMRGYHCRRVMNKCRTAKNPHAVALGSITSERKAKTSAENGRKGGRPKEEKK